MAVYIRVVDGKVVETVKLPEGTSLSDCFHPSMLDQFIDLSGIDEKLMPGHNWSVVKDNQSSQTGGWTFTPPNVFPMPTRKKTLEERLEELESRVAILEGKS